MGGKGRRSWQGEVRAPEGVRASAMQPGGELLAEGTANARARTPRTPGPPRAAGGRGKPAPESLRGLGLEGQHVQPLSLG